MAAPRIEIISQLSKELKDLNKQADILRVQIEKHDILIERLEELIATSKAKKDVRNSCDSQFSRRERS